MTIQFQIASYNDPTGRYKDGKTQVLIEKYLTALAEQFNKVMWSSNATLTIDVSVLESKVSGAYAASYYMMSGNSKSMENVVSRKVNEGIDLNSEKSDWTLTLTSEILDGFVTYAQQNPNSPIPNGYQMVLAHELGHALAFDTQRNTDTGIPITQGYETTFDRHITLKSNQAYYSGLFAKAIFGADVPLYKLGNTSSITHFSYDYLNGSLQDNIKNDLMTTSKPYPTIGGAGGSFYSDLDVAVFKDCGYKNLYMLTSYDGHTFIPGLTTNTIIGTSGLDTVICGGIRNTTTITGLDQNWSVSTNTQTISLQGIERVVFNNGDALALDLNGIAGQAYRLYQAAFDRKPDQSGLGYWIDAMDKGMTLSQVSGGFLASNEFAKLYGTNPSNTEFLTALYKNVLHRTPDGAGYEWWQARLSEGVNRATVLASFSESPENKAQVIGQISNGINFEIWNA